MENSSIARRYAEAFFTHVKEVYPDKTLKFIEELSSLSDLYNSNEDFAKVIKSPVFSHEDKKSIFESLKKSEKISDEVYKFILMLIDKGRLELLSDISFALNKFVIDSENKVEVEVVFASKVSDAIRKDLITRLEKLSNKKVVLKETVDPSLVGGVKIKMGSNLYDATIKGQLERLRLALT